MRKGFSEILQALSGKKVAVLGMGVSNTPLIRLLLDAGADVTVCDKKEEHDEKIVSEFSGKGARLFFGEDYLKNISDAEVIFKTPGMRYDIPELLSAEKNGAQVTTEMEVFFSVCPCRSIGVTGSDGKTTTTTIIGELLKETGKKTFVGGNIGEPLLPRSEQMKAADFAVAELSSFQLMNIKTGPEISVITNISPNHLDVHKSMEEYIEAKKQIYAYSSGKVVLNADNEITAKIAEEIGPRAVLFSSKKLLSDGYCLENGDIVARRGGVREKIISASDIKIPGMHNVENYMAAIAAVSEFVSKEDVLNVAKSFGGVEHRMELVRELSGVKYYNDSIASSPTRTIAGLRAFNTKVVLIAGGYDKQIPFTDLGEACDKYVKKLILVGATADQIEEAVREYPTYDEKNLPIFKCKTLREAVMCAKEVSENGDIVTLSPACASFDMFKNFMVRGEEFKRLVNSL